MTKIIAIIMILPFFIIMEWFASNLANKITKVLFKSEKKHSLCYRLCKKIVEIEDDL